MNIFSNPNGINVLSLFDGISCGQVALERANIKINKYFASEIDKHAIKVTQYHFPKTIQLGDITKINNIKTPIDLLIGGSPCQGFSYSGKQLNFNDPRSKLFFEFVRILNETKPKYFLFENVNMKQEYQDIISNLLGVKPIKIDSKLLTAQKRFRLYWCNFKINQPKNKNILFKDICQENIKGFELSDILKNRFIQYYPDNGQKLIIGSTAIKNKIGQRDRIYGINNKIPTLTATDYKQPKQILINNNLRKITPIECERLQGLPDNYTSLLSNTQRYKTIGNGWTVDIIVHILKELKNN